MELPWHDMKAAYGIEDETVLWAAHDAGELQKHLPAGWALCETDGAGARMVAVFRVGTLPTIADGDVVWNFLIKIGAANPLPVAA